MALTHATPAADLWPPAPLTQNRTMRRLLHEALRDLGHEPGRTCRNALHGMPLPPISARHRDLHDQAPLFWRGVEAITGDRDIGLHLGEAMRPRMLDEVLYLMHASFDLREALLGFIRFQHLWAGGFAARLDEERDQATLVLDLYYQGTGPLRQQAECLALLFTRIFRFLTDDDFHLVSVGFRHDAPREQSEHRRLLGVMPAFQQPHDTLCFPAALLARPSRTSNPDLHALLSGYASEQLAALEENQLLYRIRHWVDMHLERGDISLERCARTFGLSQTALRRSLAAQGVGFREIRDQVRRQRAGGILTQGGAIHEAARACGFADISPFYRAFRRWFGCTPEQFRQRADQPSRRIGENP